MLDGQHPERIGKTRASLWEIHPIMKVDLSRMAYGKRFKAGKIAAQSREF
jgi:hypothetical protein